MCGGSAEFALLVMGSSAAISTLQRNRLLLSIRQGGQIFLYLKNHVTVPAAHRPARATLKRSCGNGIEKLARHECLYRIIDAGQCGLVWSQERENRGAAIAPEQSQGFELFYYRNGVGEDQKTGAGDLV